MQSYKKNSRQGDKPYFLFADSFLSVVNVNTPLRLAAEFSAGKVVILVSAVAVDGADDGLDARSIIADVAHILIGQFLPVRNHLILTCRDELEPGVVFIRSLLIQQNEVASELRDVGGDYQFSP